MIFLITVLNFCTKEDNEGHLVMEKRFYTIFVHNI